MSLECQDSGGPRSGGDDHDSERNDEPTGTSSHSGTDGQGSGKRGDMGKLGRPFDWDSFETFDILGVGYCGTVFEAILRGEKVALKISDLWQHPELEEEMRSEARIYKVLKDLQGHAIPKFKRIGYTAGGLFALATEIAGSAIEVESLNDEEREKIVEALSDIHARGVLHDDICPENILIQRHQDGFKVAFIDFTSSKETSAKREFRREMAILKNMLKGRS